MLRRIPEEAKVITDEGLINLVMAMIDQNKIDRKTVGNDAGVRWTNLMERELDKYEDWLEILKEGK